MHDVAPAPEQIVNYCTQYGNPDLVDAVVAAFQHSHFRRQQRPPLGDKRPAGLCPHMHCSKHHSPDDCCNCNNQRHPIERCWHVVGVPENKKHMLDQFKVQQSTSSGPRVPNVKVPSVSVIQMPSDDLVVPYPTKSGIVLNEAKGNLHDVKEIDDYMCTMPKRQAL